MTTKHLYRVRFMSGDKLYELYAHDVYQGALYGFVVLEDLVFDERSSVVIDPGEEKLKQEFDGVSQTIIPMHAVVRIDEVEKKGTAKVTQLGDNVAHFPSPVYTPGKGGGGSDSS
jgi:hypothetical protein